MKTTTDDDARHVARRILEAFGEAALESLGTFDVVIDNEPQPDPSDETVDPCEQCPLDDACNTCAGYAGYACRDNPSRVLDRCVSTAPRNATPVGFD